MAGKSIFNQKEFLTLIILLVTLSVSANASAPTVYELKQYIPFSNASSTNTVVYSDTRMFSCTDEKLQIYTLRTGELENELDFTGVGVAGSTLKCFDAYANDTYALLGKDSIVIRYEVGSGTYDTYDNSLSGKTAGRLLMGGLYSVTNSPSSAQIFTLNHDTLASQTQKPIGSITADYMISASPEGGQFFVFLSRRIFSYVYDTNLNTWDKVNTLSLTPFVGSSVYWLTYSPEADIYFHSKGANQIQKRNLSDYSLLWTKNYPTEITVADIQYTSNHSDEIYIHLYNTTSLISYGEVYNLTSGTSTYEYPTTDSGASTFQYMQILADQRLMLLTYDGFGIEVYELTCPESSVYSDLAGVCLYCSETDECPVSFQEQQEQIIEFSATFYSLPTVRSALKSFSLVFLAVDSLWLYEYHNRTYGNQLKETFQAIRRIEDMKFAFLSTFEVAYEFMTNTELELENAGNYEPYTNQNYLEAEEKDGTFLLNSLDFLLFHIPGTFLTFIILRWVFFKVFQYRISSVLRLYSFWGYFFICLIEPNVEYFSFLLGNQFSLMFYINPLNKFFCFVCVFCLFWIILISVGMVFGIRYLYGKQTKLFLDNTYRIMWGYFWVFYTISVKKILTGITHSYFYNHPQAQIITLISAEVSQVLLMIFLLKKHEIFIDKTLVCGRFSLNLAIIVFQVMLSITYHIDGERSVRNLMDQCLYSTIMVIFLITLVFSFLAILVVILSPEPVYIDPTKDQDLPSEFEMTNKEIYSEQNLEKEQKQGRKTLSKSNLSKSSHNTLRSKTIKKSKVTVKEQIIEENEAEEEDSPGLKVKKFKTGSKKNITLKIYDNKPSNDISCQEADDSRAQLKVKKYASIPSLKNITIKKGVVAPSSKSIKFAKPDVKMEERRDSKTEKSIEKNMTLKQIDEPKFLRQNHTSVQLTEGTKKSLKESLRKRKYQETHAKSQYLNETELNEQKAVSQVKIKSVKLIKENSLKLK